MNWKLWLIPLACSIVHGLCVSVVFIAPQALFAPIMQSLGLTVAQASMPENIFRIMQACLQIPAGLLLDRYGANNFFHIALVATVVGSLAYCFIEQLWEWILIEVVYSLSLLFIGLSALLKITYSHVPAKYSASASSVLLTSFSVSGLIVPYAMGHLSTQLGWRQAMFILTSTFAVVAIPLSFWLLWEKERPVSNSNTGKDSVYFDRRGQKLYEDEDEIAVTKAQIRKQMQEQEQVVVNFDNVDEDHEMKTGESDIIEPEEDAIKPEKIQKIDYVQGVSGDLKPVKSHRFTSKIVLECKAQGDILKKVFTNIYFVLICLYVIAFSMCSFVIFDYFTVYLSDLGKPLTTATFLLSLMNLMALISKIVTGIFGDWVNRFKFLAFSSLLMLIGTIFLFDLTEGGKLQVSQVPTHPIAFLVIFGLGFGGCFSLITAIIPTFGHDTIAIRSSILSTLMLVFGAFSSMLAGVLRTQTHSYLSCFKIVFANATLAFTIALSIAIFDHFERSTQTTKETTLSRESSIEPYTDAGDLALRNISTLFDLINFTVVHILDYFDTLVHAKPTKKSRTGAKTIRL